MTRMDRLPPPPAHPVRSPEVAVRGEVEATIAGLEARLHLPVAPRRAVVLCHPHPLYGGSMHSPVPLAIAKTLSGLEDDAVAWARFNFRGVGKSAGSYDDGRGEVDDVLAVIAELRARAPGVPMAVCGHSFGSWVGLRAAAAVGTAGIERALLVAPSVRFFDWDEGARAEPGSREAPARAAGFLGHKTIFLGDRDEFCDLEEGRALAVRLGAELTVFEGFDHHFTKSRRAMALAAIAVILPEAQASQPGH